jgi:hypothetical protein
MARYHESKKKSLGKGERADERDMFRPEKMEGYYEGDMSRRTQEMQDAGMIREDRSQIANLPQGVMIKMYPRERDYMPEGIDDTIRGVDGQIGLDNSKRNDHFMPKKV